MELVQDNKSLKKITKSLKKNVLDSYHPLKNKL